MKADKVTASFKREHFLLKKLKTKISYKTLLCILNMNVSQHVQRQEIYLPVKGIFDIVTFIYTVRHGKSNVRLE